MFFTWRLEKQENLEKDCFFFNFVRAFVLQSLLKLCIEFSTKILMLGKLFERSKRAAHYNKRSVGKPDVFSLREHFEISKLYIIIYT